MTLTGRYVRLEPLAAAAHTDGLYRVSAGVDAPQRFRWLADDPPVNGEDMRRWIAAREALVDPLFSAVVDATTQEVLGRQALMRVVPEHGVAELGNILWGAAMARSRRATEAFYLVARHVFDELGYRRFEWKCNNDNEPSKQAAVRFGFQFEGLFRQHMWVKGRNRDTAWFAILDRDWPRLRSGFEAWLEPRNFDGAGLQRRRLAEFRAGA